VATRSKSPAAGYSKRSRIDKLGVKPGARVALIRAAALEHGLVDVKVMAFSERLSALKLVIPVARRQRGGSPRGIRSASGSRSSALPW
jgi:hypothetical protein